MRVPDIKRLLRAAIIGAPNVGKSTLLNKLIRGDISCVSNKVHTTRKNILGVYTQDLVQLEFYDSPGLINREHLLKHHLEDSLMTEPIRAAHQCDMIVVVVDASNIREKRQLNHGIVRILNDYEDKKSILVLNKVDLIKEKRQLLDISTRLTQGCSEKRRDTKHRQHQYVIELDKPTDNLENSNPDPTNFKNFSHIFSISALRDDGVDKLRDHLLSQAQPTAEWPHGPSYLSNQTSRDIVHSAIRGRVMDEAKHSAPYTIGFKYQRCDFDEMGSLHVNVSLKCPERYMVSMVIGERGVNIARIIDGARTSISRTLGCDVKLDIQVEYAPNVRRLLLYEKSKVPEYLSRESII